MKRSGFYFLPLLLAFQFQSASSSGDQHFIKQRCDAFKYEITVPAHWETDEVTLEKKHVFVSYSADTEIRVRAFVTDDADVESTVRKRRWNLRAIDPLLDNIIETEKIHIRKNIRDKLLVFEYRSNKKKVLQRTLISRSGDIIYIVDCKSPIRSFYKNEKYFNIALSSFSILGEVQNNATGSVHDEESFEENRPLRSKKDSKSPSKDPKKDDLEDVF